MDELADYHHFRRGAVPRADRVARCEQRVVELLLESELTEDQRESSLAFELKHHHSVAQFARILARKRGLSIDACTVGALLHDIYVAVEGRYADHAHLGLPIAEGVLDEIGGFSGEERSMVGRIVFHHSDKHLWSDDPFVEFGKDADVLDCFLYPGAFGFYLRHKKLDVFQHYLARAKAVWAEIGMPADPRFEILDGYSGEWFERLDPFLKAEAPARVGALLSQNGAKPVPPLLVDVVDDTVEVAISRSGSGERPSEHRSAPADPTAEGVASRLIQVAAGGDGVLVWPVLQSFERVARDASRRAELGLC